MQHEQTPLIYLSEKKDQIVKKAVIQLKPDFKFIEFNELDFLQKISQNYSHFIFLVDESNLKKLVHKFTINFTDTNLNRFYIIGIGDNVFNFLDSDAYPNSFPQWNVLSFPLNLNKVIITLKNARQHLLDKMMVDQLKQTLRLQNKELRELYDIGIALSAERNPDTLLEMILRKSREITHADAGSLYLVETVDGIPEDENNYFLNKQLRFKLAHYDLPVDSKFGHNRSFDESIGYRAKSMLIIPMKTHKDEIIGVLQLINRKKSWDTRLTSSEMIETEIIPFNEKCIDLASSLASQAAVSIENNRLYDEIKNLFEGFIRASVHAIEQRDPTTFGHSERVATLTVALAKAVDRINHGKLKNIQFTREEIQQINYAGLLHDFGKIGVREDILVKAKKLFPYELNTVKNRFKIIKQATKLKYSKEKILCLLKEEREKALSLISTWNEETKNKILELDRYFQIICDLNEPAVMQETGFEMLKKIGAIRYRDNGNTEKLLTSREIEVLSIPKGSLSDKERKEIESHVTHTFNFLTKIPWTSELKRVPQIAYAHHEKLDGSGYPFGLSSEQIPIEAKMMTIADIYDALTAWDRPYKRAVPVNKALEIIQWEVKDGKVDPDLFQIFLDAKLFELVKKPDRT